MSDPFQEFLAVLDSVCKAEDHEAYQSEMPSCFLTDGRRDSNREAIRNLAPKVCRFALSHGMAFSDVEARINAATAALDELFAERWWDTRRFAAGEPNADKLLADRLKAVCSAQAALQRMGATLPPGSESIAEQGEETGGSGKPLSAEEHKRKLDNLKPSERKAYLSFQYAESKKGKQLEDWEAWQLLKEEGISDEGDAGELADYKLPPSEGTWERQLRTARATLGEQKNQRRHGRSHGKSIVKGHDIERQLEDEQ